MNAHWLVKWAPMMIAFLASNAESGSVHHHIGPAEGGRSCHELRQEVTRLFQHPKEGKSPPTWKQVFPEWVERFFSVVCDQEGIRLSNNGHFPMSGHERAIDHLKHSGTRMVVADSLKSQPAEGKSDTGTFINKHAAPVIDGPLKNRPQRFRGTRIMGDRDGKAALHRKKRFFLGGPDLGTMAMGSLSPTPGKEASDTAMMMDSLLMFTKMQKLNLAQEYRSLRRQGNNYAGERMSFGSGYYGDIYPGRKKREATNERAVSGSSEAKIRKKRFFFGGEPTEAQTMPSLFNMMMGTARDPNTGKKLEFGGDLMRNSMANTFMAFLPPGLQPPPGKEPGDMMKNLAPHFLFSNFGSSGKRRVGNGLYGDVFPGKKRRKRSPEVSNSNNSNNSSSVGNNNTGTDTNIVVLGDVSNLLKLLKPREKGGFLANSLPIGLP